MRKCVIPNNSEYALSWQPKVIIRINFRHKCQSVIVRLHKCSLDALVYLTSFLQNQLIQRVGFEICYEPEEEESISIGSMAVWRKEGKQENGS